MHDPCSLIGQLVLDPFEEYGVGIIIEYDIRRHLVSDPNAIYPYRIVFPGEDDDWWREDSVRNMIHEYKTLLEKDL